MPRGTLTPGFSPPTWQRFGSPRGDTRTVGGRALMPVDIPVCWFSQPLTLRLEKPFNHAEVTQLDGATARADNSTSQTTYGGVFPFAATLSTAVDADATNLAHWTVTYNPDPRMRSPRLVLNLLYRSDEEKLRILGVTRGERIRITDLPTQWPAGANTLIVAGATHAASEVGRVVEWATGPVIGTAAGIAGPWFRRGTSARGGVDIRPF